MTTTYDDSRWGTLRRISLRNTADGGLGSAVASQTILDRRTFMANVTIKDMNLAVDVGATCTGTGGVATEVYTLKLGYSTAGTGTITAIGTATIGTGGQADNTVLDGTVTETNLSSGDDILFYRDTGTALGDNSLVVRDLDVSYVERYVAS